MHYYMVHILYYSEINLQLRAKMTHLSQIGKYAPDERIRGIFASAERLPTFATLPSVYPCFFVIFELMQTLHFLLTMYKKTNSLATG